MYKNQVINGNFIHCHNLHCITGHRQNIFSFYIIKKTPNNSKFHVLSSFIPLLFLMFSDFCCTDATNTTNMAEFHLAALVSGSWYCALLAYWDWPALFLLRWDKCFVWESVFVFVFICGFELHSTNQNRLLHCSMLLFIMMIWTAPVVLLRWWRDTLHSCIGKKKAFVFL